MGKMKALLLDMEEFALDRSKKEFLKKYPNDGEIWDRMNDPNHDEGPDEPYIIEEKSA